MRRLLLIEDEEVILKALTRLLERNRYETVAVRDIDAAEAAHPDTFDIVLADLRLPGRDGTAVIPLADPAPVVVMTSHASVRSAVEAMRAGASDYIAKPFDHDELLLVLERALSRNRLSARNRALERDLARAEPAAGRVRGTSLDRLVTELLDAPDPDAPLHLHGEPGTGREDVARELHARGARADGPLVVLDGDDTRRDGAYRGPDDGSDGDPSSPARDATITALDTARGGTLVLRHPERLPASARDALVDRLATSGGTSLERTSAPFAFVTIGREAIGTPGPGDAPEPDAGAFDASALATLLVPRQRAVPRLEERRGDVAPLARRAAAACGRRHLDRAATLSDAALALLGARDWPGGVAALERTVELAVLRTATTLANASSRHASPDRESGEIVLREDAFGTVPDTLDLDAYFRYVVQRLQPESSETDIAARLGISRKALWERRHRMGLPRPSGGVQKT